MSEVNHFAEDGYDLPIDLIEYDVASNHLYFTINGKDEIAGWDVLSQKIIFRTQTSFPSFKGLGFDNNAKVILGATNSDQEMIDGIGVWKITTGELIQCIVYPCDNSKSNLNDEDLGAVIDPNGQFVISFDQDSFNITGINGWEFNESSLVNSPDQSYFWHIGNIAIDSLNQRFAIVFQEGRIELRSLNAKNIGSLGISNTLTEGKIGDTLTINDAQFDQNGRWLAFVRGNHVVVLQIDGFKKIFFDALVDGAFGLRFNSSGNLLIVTSPDKITILSVDQKRLVAEYAAPSISTFDISDDDRLLVWGDKFGTIHIWGIHK